MRNTAIRIKAIRRNWTLEEILDEAAIDEEVKKQAGEIEKKLTRDEKEIKRITREPIKPCDRCGRKHTGEKCPAIGATCNT